VDEPPIGGRSLRDVHDARAVVRPRPRENLLTKGFPESEIRRTDAVSDRFRQLRSERGKLGLAPIRMRIAERLQQGQVLDPLPPEVIDLFEDL